MRRNATLASQTSKYEDVTWSNEVRQPITQVPSGVQSVTTAPANLHAGLDAESARPPFWIYDYEFSSTSGLVITNLKVRDTQSAGSLEDVFERIDFTDLAVGFTDGSAEGFVISRAFANPASDFQIAENGRISGDELFQRGIRLHLVDNVLAHRGGTCDVTLDISVVFRGAKNDFDPGGVPVALIVWPELSFTWSRERATKTVNRFRGSVRMTARNSMYPGHAHHGGAAPPLENNASFFTDTNAMGLARLQRPNSGLRATGAFYMGQPFGWSQVFDYLAPNVQQARELVAVYGPGSGSKYNSGASDRELPYEWPGSGARTLIWVTKVARQGDYDNIHSHARMPNNDRCGNLQIHAPFCGHSCVHMHWRWSAISSHGAPLNGWRYRGWSNPGDDSAQAHADDNAPLVPPNQHIMVALCPPGHTRFDDSHIVNPASPPALDPLRKLIYYSVRIHDPRASDPQVVLCHGIGWAYRYSTPSESEAVLGLQHGLLDSLPDSPTQDDMSTFFEDSVYPTFRYVGGIVFFDCTQQVPSGSHNAVIPAPWPMPTRPIVSMEDL